MKACQPGKKLNVEVILISEFITSTFRVFCQADMLRGLHFEKHLLVDQMIRRSFKGMNN